jgi:hypothetical protein
MLAWVLGENTCLRLYRSGCRVLESRLGRPLRQMTGIDLGLMSGAWLRQHDADSEKHGAGP